jgi:hypothetical protein
MGCDTFLPSYRLGGTPSQSALIFAASPLSRLSLTITPSDWACHRQVIPGGAFWGTTASKTDPKVFDVKVMKVRINSFEVWHSHARDSGVGRSKCVLFSALFGARRLEVRAFDLEFVSKHGHWHGVRLRYGADFVELGHNLLVLMLIENSEHITKSWSQPAICYNQDLQ